MMKMTTTIDQQEQEDTRRSRSETPRTTVQSNEHFEGMLDNKRFDSAEEKIDWRLD